MRTTIIKISLILLTGTLMLDCKKQKNVIPVGITANADNLQWVATTYSARIDTVHTSLEIYGYDSSYSGAGQGDIYIFIPYYNGNTGIYELNTTGTMSTIFYSDFTGRIYISTSGTITLTKITTDNIQGTFNCLLLGGPAITNGQFNLPIK